MTKVAPSKDELEREKLALEIRELQRKWWQRPAYLSALLPMVLASLTVLAAQLSGYFDRERAQLKNDISALQNEKSALIKQSSQIAAEYERSRRRALELNAEIEKNLQSLLDLDATPTPSPSPPSN